MIIADMTPRLACSGLRCLLRPKAFGAVFAREDEPAITQAGVNVLVVSVPGEVSQRLPAVRAPRRKVCEHRAVMRSHVDD